MTPSTRLVGRPSIAMKNSRCGVGSFGEIRHAPSTKEGDRGDLHVERARDERMGELVGDDRGKERTAVIAATVSTFVSDQKG